MAAPQEESVSLIVQCYHADTALACFLRLRKDGVGRLSRLVQFIRDQESTSDLGGLNAVTLQSFLDVRFFNLEDIRDVATLDRLNSDSYVETRSDDASSILGLGFKPGRLRSVDFLQVVVEADGFYVKGEAGEHDLVTATIDVDDLQHYNARLGGNA